MTPSLEEIQEHLLDRLHRGEPIDADAVLARHPEHAPALREFLRVLDAIEAPPPRESVPARLGDFQIVRELGRGGMGIVYEAVQLSLKRRVALKILPPALGGSSALSLRFRREAEAAGRLRHPGIVAVHSSGEVGGTPFFAMELIEGRSLADVIARLKRDAEPAAPSGGKAPPAGEVPPAGEARRRWAVELAARVADALAYAHAQGIVHRDVKPSNILLEADGTPRLSDFGLALDLGGEGLTLSGEVCGSPRYMSPEQAFRRQRPIDGRSDVYSLGVTLYELLTLRFPYEGATSSEYLMQVSEGRLVAPRAVDPAIPPALESVLLKALARDPEARYAGAAELAADLRDVLAQRWPASRGAPSLRTAERVAAATATVARSRWPRVAAIFAVVFFGLSGMLATCVMLLPAPAPAPQANAEPQDRSAPITAAELELLADGRHPNGPARLMGAARVTAELRSVVALDALGMYPVSFELPVAGDVPPGISFTTRWSAAESGELPHLATQETAVPLIVVGKVAASELLSQAEALRLDPSRPPTELPAKRSIAHEFTLRVCRDGKTMGTIARLELSPKEVAVHAKFPEGYPELVVDETADRDMRRHLTPSRVEFAIDRSRPEGAGVLCTFELPGTPRTLAFAGRISLALPGEERAFAGTKLVLAPAASQSEARKLRLFVPFGPWSAAEQDELVRRLGSASELRVRLEADRDVARANSNFDRVWGGALDVEVPRERRGE